MAEDPKTPAEAPHFETDELETNDALEQGLGLGARELAAIGESGAEGTLEIGPDAADRKPVKKKL
jgi:hypothetical protein